MGKESKGQLEGHVDKGDDDFLQIKTVALLALTRDVQGLSAAQLKTLGQLAKVGDPGDAYDYSYHSNDIIGVLVALKKTFLKEKRRLFDEEYEAQTVFDKAVLAM